MRTKEEIAQAHDKLAEFHEFLARTSMLDVIHEFHEAFGERLREEARSWRDMSDTAFEFKIQGWPPR